MREISIYSGIPIVTLYENVKPNDAASGKNLGDGIFHRLSRRDHYGHFGRSFPSWTEKRRAAR